MFSVFARRTAATQGATRSQSWRIQPSPNAGTRRTPTVHSLRTLLSGGTYVTRYLGYSLCAVLAVACMRPAAPDAVESAMDSQEATPESKRLALPSCEHDLDCSGGFCGCADVDCASGICRPWSLEGESCGGFLLPMDQTRCAPGLFCVPDARNPERPGRCIAHATVAEILADPAAYDGLLVGVRGWAGPAALFCTVALCSPETCCNACAGDQRLFDEPDDGPFGGLPLFEGGESLRCGGNECAVECDREEGPYRVVGAVAIDERGVVRLEVDDGRRGP